MKPPPAPHIAGTALHGTYSCSSHGRYSITWNILLLLTRQVQHYMHCKTDESHVPHKFTKKQLGPMTNVISPNSIKI
jgi:hypothetical protein